MSSCLISGEKKPCCQYIIWSKFHIQTTEKKNLKKKKGKTQTHAHTQWKRTEADAMQHFLARLLGKCINTASFLSY